VTALLLPAPAAHAEGPYRWLPAGPREGDTFEARFPPPEGFARRPCETCAWFRGLPLRPGRPEVRLFDGRPKANQRAHLAVIDVDVGRRDLQQCADAAMRLWAERLFALGEDGDLCVPLTSGAALPWARWRRGERPRVEGAALRWVPRARPSSTPSTFRAYLDFAFTYAGTASIERRMSTRLPLEDLRPGDVFVQGGFPGHAVLVIDVAEGPDGRRAFALAQSYMPAQDVHVLDNPRAPGRPWYELAEGEALETPEWRFPPRTQARLRRDACR
jgi:hypothetical protein